MVSWVILVVLVLVVAAFLKFRHMKHRFFLIIILLLLIFIYTTMSNVIKNNNLNVTTMNGMVTAGKLYFSWLGHIFGNVKDVTGDVIKMNWAGNSSVK